MAWLESHQTLADHPKTRKLSRILGTSKPTTIGHLHCLWWWALDYADDGDLSRYDALDIAIGAEWDGDPATVVEALIAAGFLDRNGDNLVIHDWDHYAGKLIDRRRQNAQRMREARAKHGASSKEEDGDTNAERAAHVQCTQRARAELPNQTQPNLTNQTGPNPLSPGADAPEGGASPSKKKARKKTLTAVQQERFDRWYAAFPKKRSPAEAEKAWASIDPDDELTERMIAKVEEWAESHEWTKDGGQYCPYPATWLNKGRWRDGSPAERTTSTLTFMNGGKSGTAVDRNRENFAAYRAARGGQTPQPDSDVIDTTGRMTS